MACLESLPPELQIWILESLPDTTTLRALVRSSPRYHAVYLDHRQQILFSVLSNTLRSPLLFLSYVLEEVSLIPELSDHEEHRGNMHKFKRAFVQHFCGTLVAQAPQSWLPIVDLETLISVCRRHWLIESVAAQYFTTNIMWQNLSGYLFQSFDPPSQNEIHRLHRALYQFEIYCRAYFTHGVNGRPVAYYNWLVNRGPIDQDPSSFRHHFLVIDVEDAEGVACLREYFCDYYTQRLSSNCRIEMLERPSGCRPISHMRRIGEEKIEYWMSLGLRFFQRICQAPTTEAQAQILYQHSFRRHRQFLSSALRSFRFNGTSHLQAGPPRVVSWPRTSDLRWFMYKRFDLQKLGYIFWDRQRLEMWMSVGLGSVHAAHASDTVPVLMGLGSGLG